MIILAQKTKLFSLDNDIAPTGRMELAIEIFQVGFNGFRRDTELVSDLFVTLPFLQKQQTCPYSPLNSGLRFSRNALMPSF